MTREELSLVLELNEYYVEKHWSKVVKARKNEGIELRKLGRGPTANYGIKLFGEDEFVWDFDLVEKNW